MRLPRAAARFPLLIEPVATGYWLNYFFLDAYVYTYAYINMSEAYEKIRKVMLVFPLYSSVSNAEADSIIEAFVSRWWVKERQAESNCLNPKNSGFFFLRINRIS